MEEADVWATAKNRSEPESVLREVLKSSKAKNVKYSSWNIMASWRSG